MPIDSSFREIASVSMNNIQRDTMSALIDDDNAVEKLRGGELILYDEDNKNNTIANLTKASNNTESYNNTTTNTTVNLTKNNTGDNKHLEGSLNKRDEILSHDGPIKIPNFNFYSFLELDPQFTKPISVKMKMPSDADPSILTQIDLMEFNRHRDEYVMCDKAKKELLLITAETTKILQNAMHNKLLPFYVVSHNVLESLKDVIQVNVPKHELSPAARFLEIDEDDLKSKFPEYRNKTIDPVTFNKEIYSKVLALFTDIQEGGEPVKSRLIPSMPVNEATTNQQDLINSNPDFLNDGSFSELKPVEENARETQIDNTIKKAVDFNFEKCKEMAELYKNFDIDCNNSLKDWEEVKSYLKTSFMEFNNEDFINVKFASADDSYPTIEKLVAQMMTRRDLAEKFLRLKILESQSRFLKALSEMIQEELHTELYKIIAKYAPTLEGLKEYLKSY
jgi:hypothetical protein